MIYADGKPTTGASATGVTGLALGATALAGVLSQNSNCGGLLGGLFGGNNCHQEKDTRIIATLESQLAKEQAERYADSIGIASFKEANSLSKENDAKINANYKELAQAFATLDKNVAVESQRVNDNFRFLDNKIDCTKTQIVEYVNGHFVPGKLIMPIDSICPRPMPACTPVVAPAQVMCTRAAETEGEVSLGSKK